MLFLFYSILYITNSFPKSATAVAAAVCSGVAASAAPVALPHSAAALHYLCSSEAVAAAV